MTTRAIVNGDMSISKFLTGAQEVAQNVETRLLMFYGEAFLDTSNGVPWFETIFGRGNATEYDKESVIKKTILETNGVEKITSFSMTLNDRAYNVTVSIIALGESETVTVTV